MHPVGPKTIRSPVDNSLLLLVWLASHPAESYCIIKFVGACVLRLKPRSMDNRGNLRTRIAISRRRTVAIECGMCRSGRRGGASGSVTVG